MLSTLGNEANVRKPFNTVKGHSYTQNKNIPLYLTLQFSEGFDYSQSLSEYVTFTWERLIVLSSMSSPTIAVVEN